MRIHQEDLINRRDELLVRLLELLRAALNQDDEKTVRDLLIVIQTINNVS